jgi:hypothetical protein
MTHAEGLVARHTTRRTRAAGAALAGLTCLAVALAACDRSQENAMSTTTQTPSLTRAQWDALSARSVFFGHQSVGDNMLDGVQKLGKTEGWPELRIIEQSGAPASKQPSLMHAKIGQNGDPQSKVKAFKDALDAGVGQQVDIALMKFCFWDIRHETNIDAVFNEYRSTMADLERRYPNVTFVHATVPLVAADMDWKARVRRMIGQKTNTDIDNGVRETLNQKIRNEYANRAIVLDIAKAESDSDGPMDNPQLAASLSSDGAHLNDAGRRRVGAEFVKALSDAATRMGADR